MQAILEAAKLGEANLRGHLQRTGHAIDMKGGEVSDRCLANDYLRVCCWCGGVLALISRPMPVHNPVISSWLWQSEEGCARLTIA